MNNDKICTFDERVNVISFLNYLKRNQNYIEENNCYIILEKDFYKYLSKNCYVRINQDKTIVNLSTKNESNDYYYFIELLTNKEKKFLILKNIETNDPEYVGIQFNPNEAKKTSSFHVTCKEKSQKPSRKI